MSVYLDKKAETSSATQALAKQLRARPDVAAVRVITADQALADFRDTSGFGKALDALTDNPLPDTLVVTPTPRREHARRDPGAQAGASRRLPTCDMVQLDTEWVQRLNALLELLRRVVWLTGALSGLGVMLVVGNTIRLDILNRRAEIEVMKLVGATDRFARRPFLYGGSLVRARRRLGRRGPGRGGRRGACRAGRSSGGAVRQPVSSAGPGLRLGASAFWGCRWP